MNECNPAKCIQWTLLLFNAILLIISRWHYTVDVILGYWLATFVFIIYHTYCRQCHTSRSTSDANLLLITFIFKVSSPLFICIICCSGSKRTHRLVACRMRTISHCRVRIVETIDSVFGYNESPEIQVSASNITAVIGQRQMMIWNDRQ